MNIKPLALASLLLVSISHNVIADNTISAEANAQTISSAQESTEQRIQRLSYVAQNQAESPETRVDALHELSQYPNQNALVAVTRALKDGNSDVREAAIVGAKPYQFEYRWKLVSSLLSDDKESVQIAAAINLLPDYSTMTEEQQHAIDKVYPTVTTYLERQSGKRSQLLLGDVYRWHMKWERAEQQYLALIDDPELTTQASLSLSDNFRAQSNDQQALEVLNSAIERDNASAQLQYAKALTLVRMDDKPEAASAIEKATDLAPENSYYWYLNGVLQEPLNVAKATQSFEQAYMISGAPEQLYAVCDMYVRHNNPKEQACLDELSKVAPPYVVEQLKDKNNL